MLKCYLGRKRRRVRQEEQSQRQRPQLIVHDSPTNYPKKEVTFVEKDPSAPPQTVIRRYSESDDDDSFYRPKIPSQNIWTTNNFVNTAPYYPSHEYAMSPPPPPPPPTYVVKDKWDPYDSESDVPFLFQFEGETTMLSPATSLSSLASSHLVRIISKYLLQHA